MKFWDRLKAKAKEYHAQKMQFFENVKARRAIIEGFEINEQYEEVLKIVGTLHGNGLSMVKEAGVVKNNGKLL